MKRVYFGVALLVLSGLTGIAPSARSQSPEPAIAIEGLDPVLLVSGKETQGNMKITTTRGQFQYLFFSEENKAVFDKDPARYEIQLDGLCARMGPLAQGNPDLYAVYKGRIYIFGSPNCKKMFEADPASFLESETGAAPKPEATAEAMKKGRALIEKAVQAMGGAAKIDGLTAYQEKGGTVAKTPQGEIALKTVITVVFPDRFRQERTRDNRTIATVVTPAEAFTVMRETAYPMIAAQHIEMKKMLKRNPLAILRARQSAGFKATAAGTGKAGETTVAQVAVELDGVITWLGIDAATGRILSLSYRGRGPTGAFGDLSQTFSDFRTVEGLSLPFKKTGTFNSEADAASSSVVESITVNGNVAPATFEKPKMAAR